MRRLAVIIAVAATLACIAAAAASPAVPFRTVARDDGAASDMGVKTALLVRNATHWQRVWRRLNGGLSPRPAAPRVSFARHMLIVVVHGRAESGGHSIRITGVRDRGARLAVFAHERAPGRDCVTPSVITSPYHLVRVRRGPERLSVARTRTTYDC